MYDFGVDIDGVLCAETTGHDYATRTPIHRNIEKIKTLNGSVCFYSARRIEDLEVTYKWLQSVGLEGQIFLGKPLCKQYLDDSMLSIEAIGRKRCLLFTGGLDSWIAYHFLGKPETIYFDLGHRYALKEKEAILRLVPKTKIFSDLSLANKEKEDAHIPGRNLFVSMLAASEGYDDIFLIVQKDETNIPDRTKSFFRHTSTFLSDVFDRDIHIDTPFWDMDKTDMLRWYWLNKHDQFSALNVSVSCFDSEKHQCGDCPACFRKAVAMANCGINQYSMFSENPFESKTAQVYRGNLDKYSFDRRKRIENAFSIYKS